MNDDKSDQKMSTKLDNVVGTFGDRPCGCKGIRTCLLCEKDLLIFQRNELVENQQLAKTIVYTFCSQCGTKAWLNDDHRTHHLKTYDSHEGSSSSSPCQQKKSISSSILNPTIVTENDDAYEKLLPQFVPVKGITLISNVINEDEEQLIVSLIDDPETPSPWVSSQSGRRKQDYGPKVNFRKQKVKLTGFHGLPDYGHKLFRKLSMVTEVLNDFIPVELCNLEYVPERGSSIDPHLDDDWLWGERLVTINLISETRLTLSPVVRSQGKDDNHSQLDGDYNHRNVEIEIPLPCRSLLILYDEARYKWYHAIKREHITSRRIGITIRELTSLFLPKGQLYSSIGEEILSIASKQLSCKLSQSEQQLEEEEKTYIDNSNIKLLGR